MFPLTGGTGRTLSCRCPAAQLLILQYSPKTQLESGSRPVFILESQVKVQDFYFLQVMTSNSWKILFAKHKS